MNAAQLVLLLVKASLLLIVFSLGLRATFSDATFLLRRPGQLARALLAMNISMPVFVAAMVLSFTLIPIIRLDLLVLAVSPVPPFLPMKQFKLGGTESYVYGLLVAVSLFAIVFVPLAVWVLGVAFGVRSQMHVGAVARIVLLSVLLPLLTGMVVRLFARNSAESAAKKLSRLGAVLLVVGLIPMLMIAWRPMLALIGNGTLLALTTFVVVGLGVGHLFGGPSPGDRSALALATASRHPAVALAIASDNLPDEKLVSAAILLYLVVNVLVSIPYIKWRERQRLHDSGKAEGGARWRHGTA